ncbi:MAG: phosphoribosylformylglycinamidine synthase subunit PurS [bacterium]|nr:MAG: phosphoribosylformylglycinamidine synthase subunit PurS [bacterium]
MKVRINIYLKDEILDPEGKAIEKVINRAGYGGIKNVRVRKTIDMDIDAAETEALKIAGEVAQKILINPVIHEADIKRL